MKKILLIGSALLLLVIAIFVLKPNKGVTSDFPVPKGAKNVTKVSEGGLNYQTSMTVYEVETYYREALTGMGYTERKELTSTTDTTLSFVFDGHELGIPLIVQAVALDTGSNVNIRLASM